MILTWGVRHHPSLLYSCNHTTAAWPPTFTVIIMTDEKSWEEKYEHMKRECQKMAVRYVSTQDDFKKLKTAYDDLIVMVQSINNTMILFTEAIDRELNPSE